MTAPLLSLLVAGSLHWAPPVPARADFELLAIEIAQAVEPGVPVSPDLDAPEDTVGVPTAYDRLLPAPEPAALLLVTYDWRSPVVFDLP